MILGRLIAIAFIFLTISAISTVSAEHTIQIGALSKPYPAFAKAARQVGNVESGLTEDGLTLYQVGRYSTRDEAVSALQELRDAGYQDAFIRRLTGSRSMQAGPRTGFSDLSAVLDQLPEETRSKVVYLDGVLHVKEGDQFTPLREYSP